MEVSANKTEPIFENNFESCKGELEEKINIPFACLLLVLGIITVIGNTFTVLSYVICKTIRQLTLNIYIFNLAIADLGMGIFVFILYFVWEIQGKPVLTVVETYLWNSIFRLCLYLSVLSVILMSYDRYVMVSNPISYRLKSRKKTAWIKIIIVWVIGLALSFIFETYALKIVEKSPYRCRQYWTQIDDYTNLSTALMLTIDFALPFLVLIILNLMVFYKIWKRSHDHLEKNMNNLGFSRKSLNKELWFQWKRMCISKCSRTWGLIGKGSKDVYQSEHPDEQSESTATSSTIVRGPTTNYETTEQDGDNKNGDLESNLSDETLKTGTENSVDKSISLVSVENLNVPSQHRFLKKDSLPVSRKQAMTLLNKRMTQEHKRLRKTARCLLTFVMVFFVCWTPFYIVYTVSCFTPPSASLTTAKTISSVILWCNSLINPFLYAAMSQAYRDFLRRYILRRK